MLRLQSTEPAWLGDLPGDDADPRPFLLPGVRVQFAPIGPKAYRAAGKACVAVLTAEGENEDASDALARELIIRGIIAWEGIGDADGEPVEPTEAAKAAFVADPRTFLAAEAAYVTPYLLRDLEGNASAGSPDGTGRKATPAPATATPASSPAPASGAKPTRPKAPKRARTASTSPRPTKAKRSGRS